MTTRNSRTITEPAERVLKITRTFDAPRSLVFQVWTRPEHWARWLGPREFTAPFCEMDFRSGGAYRACIRSLEGHDYWMRGIYREIVEPERIVFTFAWEDEKGERGHETLVTVTFAEQNGKTTLTFHQAVFESAADRDSHREGWSECLDRLEAYLQLSKGTDMTTRNGTDEAQIGQLMDDWTNAIRVKDVDALMSCYQPEILWFDLAPPLRNMGANAYRKEWEEWFATWEGPIGYEIRDLSITPGDMVAFSTSLNRISGTRTGGEKDDVWIRATVCFRKVNGNWMITHEHFSVPFYMDGSYRAAVDLKPQ